MIAPSVQPPFAAGVSLLTLPRRSQKERGMKQQRHATDIPLAVLTPAARTPDVKKRRRKKSANSPTACVSPVPSAHNVACAGAPVIDHGRIAVHPQQGPNTAPHAQGYADHAFSPRSRSQFGYRLPGDSNHGDDLHQGAPVVHCQPQKPPTQDITPILASLGQDLFFNPGTQLPDVSNAATAGPTPTPTPVASQPQQPRQIFDGPSSWIDPQLVQLLQQQQQQQQQLLQQQEQQRRQQPQYTAFRVNGSGNPVVILQAPVASGLSGWPDARVAGGITRPNSHDADASVYKVQSSVAPMPLVVETPHADNMMAATLEFGDGSRGGDYMQPTMDLSCGIADPGMAYPDDIKPSASLLNMAYPEDIRRAEIDFCSRKPGAAGGAVATANSAAAHTLVSSLTMAATALEAAMQGGEDTKPDFTKRPYRVGTKPGPAITKATQRSSRGDSSAASSRCRHKHLCKFCSRVLDTKYKLERHLRIHTGERPFECKKCGNRFNQKSSLKTHSNIHAREALKDPATTGDVAKGLRINGYSLDQLGIPYAKHTFDAIYKGKAESKRKEGASA